MARFEARDRDISYLLIIIIKVFQSTIIKSLLLYFVL